MRLGWGGGGASTQWEGVGEVYTPAIGQLSSVLQLQ